MTENPDELFQCDKCRQWFPKKGNITKAGGVVFRALGDFLEAVVRWALCWSYFMCWALSALLYLGILGLLLLKWLAY